MITYERIIEAQDDLVKYWKEDGKRVIEAALHSKKDNISYDEFLNHCIACGGNWGSMLLTGIKELYPLVWEVIPEYMGQFAWVCLCHTLILCGVQPPESKN